MLQVRVMPVLLSSNRRLVKTVRFSKPMYVGDPLNAIRIYNDKEVDELIVLDITATTEGRSPDFEFLAQLAEECFMPLCYGGGIRTLDEVKRIFSLGIEKVALNSAAFENPKLVSEVASIYGNQSVVVSIDVKKTWFGKYSVYTRAGTCKTKWDPILWAKEVVSMGAGEILLTSVDREGTWEGFDIDLISSVARQVSIPVVASGGAGTLEHFKPAIVTGGASAIALGSMAVFQGRGLGVLIGFPSQSQILHALNGSL